MQGLNATISIYEQVQQADDSVGGSVRTDALRYANVKCRISNARPSSLLMQQGFEVTQTNEIIIYPDVYPNVREQDIVIPLTGQWVGGRLLVVAVQRSSLPPGHPRSHVQLFTYRLAYADMNTAEASLP